MRTARTKILKEAKDNIRIMRKSKKLRKDKILSGTDRHSTEVKVLMICLSTKFKKFARLREHNLNFSFHYHKNE